MSNGGGGGTLTDLVGGWESVEFVAQPIKLSASVASSHI
jgi:hypothetical protein